MQRGAARCSVASGSSYGAGMAMKGRWVEWSRGPLGIGRGVEMGEYGDPLARIAQDTLGFRAQEKWTAWPARRETDHQQ